jgi:molecular chaperone GrpE
MAEFDNYKRRMAREYDRIVELANERLMLDIIGVRESLERAIAAAGSAAGDSLSEGQKLIAAQLDEALKKHGLSTFGAEGDLFDPELHDALMRTAHESIAADNVAQVFEKGYKLRNRIIRHAKVVVSGGPAEKEAPLKNAQA